MAAFAAAKESFLRGFLKLENGLPSQDTFSRLFHPLDPEQFRTVFQRFMARFSETVRGVVGIDGKVLRRSFDRASARSALHMVSAWGCEQRIVLAQIATDAKSNEIAAMRKLLDALAQLSGRRAEPPCRTGSLDIKQTNSEMRGGVGFTPAAARPQCCKAGH